MSAVLAITVTSVTFSPVNTTIPASTKDSGYIYFTTAVFPTASGTIPDCYEYQDASKSITPYRFLAWSYESSTDQLIAWNLSSDTNISTYTLDPAHSYYILLYQNSTDLSFSRTYCMPTNATEPDTITNCNTTMLSKTTPV
ncbi:hypothetical protein N7491_001474 [Penicillium cf. griseofulvum]|uniref:Uncharacterized protein n=1 Tax=Penicillium cf. griseofulvum TaxID=2972120 RepID=A0A9W9M9Y7_9EURO|nr:hypothetical protein N7472_006605 [Penicillium cf. griseofulvum]KAJ5445392.1 hypothetical protein N7491_001474 [Penicillium cf. griseofulvum]KAJ5447111.1 hypothetical protein N7445_001932 [Penicillium cf. griseofulvum]